MDLSLIPFVEARWYQTTSGRVIDLIVRRMSPPEQNVGVFQDFVG